MQETFEAELVKIEAEVKENTLRTIAGELHDNIGQMLSITAATLSSINLANSPKAGDKLHYAQDVLNNSIKEVRQLAKLLQADSLLEEGLFQAIEQETDRIKRIGIIDVTIEQQSDDSYQAVPDKELFIFRLVQETLSNIIRHSEATAMHVKINFAKKMLYLTIADNGKGFDTTSTTSKGIGVSNMYKRASFINGQLQINTTPNKGTIVNLTVPYA
jgi:signal transduction histidine kinase